jgi:hypothetical protein
VQIQPVLTAQVTGRLEGPGLHGGEYVRLSRTAWQGLTPDLDQDGPSAMADSADRFVLPAVPPGEYVVRATAGEGSSRYFVATPLTVAGPEVDVTAITRPVLHVTFRFQFEGETEKPGPPTGFVSPMLLERVDGGPVPQEISGSIYTYGRSENTLAGFRISGFQPGRYRVVVQNSPADWMFESAMFNGVDVSETPFDLTRDVEDIVLKFTDRWSGIRGLVRGEGADAAAVLAFPADSQAWGGSRRRLRSTTASPEGKFGISSLPPGEYFIVAIPDEQAFGWTDGKTLDALVRIATRITITAGEFRTVDLDLRQVPQ